MLHAVATAKRAGYTMRLFPGADDPSMQTDPQLTLYGTQACHLCEEASSLLALLAGNGVQVREQDITERAGSGEIAESAELMARYQLRIPVLRRADTGAELDWPFNLPQLMDWLGDVLVEEG